MNEPTVTAETLNDLRQRYLDGKPWTREELKNAIHTMIGTRLTAVQESAKPKTKTKATPVSLDDLLIPEAVLPAPVKEAAKIVAEHVNEEPVKKNTSGFF